MAEGHTPQPRFRQPILRARPWLGKLGTWEFFSFSCLNSGMALVNTQPLMDCIVDERGEYSSHQSLTITIKPSILASRDPSSHRSLTISPSILPSSDNVIFSESSFFKHHGVHAALPTPSVVREEAAKPKNLPGRWANKPWAVPILLNELACEIWNYALYRRGAVHVGYSGHAGSTSSSTGSVWLVSRWKGGVHLYAAHRRSNTRRCMRHFVADRPCIYPPRIASNRSISAVSSSTFW